jgi:uncharacterized membrane protein YkoI
MLPALCIAVLAMCAAQAGEPPAAKADPPRREDPREKEDAPESRPKLISEDRIIKQFEKRYQARVVRLDKGESRGRPVYRLRLVSDTKVQNIMVDAETGEELK